MLLFRCLNKTLLVGSHDFLQVCVKLLSLIPSLLGSGLLKAVSAEVLLFDMLTRLSYHLSIA